MNPPICSFLIICLLSCVSCAGDPFSGARYSNSPQIINVSSYDPKERQRSGSSYSVSDVGALKKNGAHGLIARISKGTVPDEKAARFLQAADREGMLIGAYHFVLPGTDVARQADRFVDRVRATANSMRLKSPQILLVGDFDSKTPAREMARFIRRIEQRTGVLPIVYLENADSMKIALREADPVSKATIRRCPYWMALYGHVDKMDSKFSVKDRPLTPEVLLDIYDTWDSWTLWQYGGVWWDRRNSRSVAYHYDHSSFRSPPYFGGMDRPMERNVFNGSVEELHAFWAARAWSWRGQL